MPVLTVGLSMFYLAADVCESLPLTFTSLALIGSHYKGHVILCFVLICGWLLKCCEVFTVCLTELMSRVVATAGANVNINPD